MEPIRTAILQLYDHLASQITLDFTSATPHILGCDGTLRHTSAWIAMADPTHQDGWQFWLDEMCIDCDCSFLLQVNTLAVEHGGLEGINMRRCSSCNTLLALYQVTRTPAAPDPDLIAWAAKAGVPAYIVTLVQADVSHQAVVRKVYPAGTNFVLTDQQFYGSVLQHLEEQHHCQSR